MTKRRMPGSRARSVPVALAVVAMLVGACGGQIPFGTPRPQVTAPPSAAASIDPTDAATSAPSAGASPGTTAGPTAEPTDAPLPTPPSVAVTYSVGEAGFAITLPPGWVGYGATSPEAAIAAAAAEHPELRNSLDLLRAGQLGFVAVDATATGEGHPPSAAISVPNAAIPPGPLLENFAASIAANIATTQPVDGEVDVVPVELESGPALNLRWQLLPDGEAEALALDAYVVSLGRAYVLTFAAPASTMDGFRPAFARIAGSMQPI